VSLRFPPGVRDHRGPGTGQEASQETSKRKRGGTHSDAGTRQRTCAARPRGKEPCGGAKTHSHEHSHRTAGEAARLERGTVRHRMRAGTDTDTGITRGEMR